MSGQPSRAHPRALPHTAHSLRLSGRIGAAWLLPLALVALLPVGLFFWRRTLNTTFFSLSTDDFHRTLMGWEATQGKLLPSEFWPPLQFWLEGLLLQVYPHLLSVPYLLNLGLSTGALVCLVGLCAALEMRPLAAALAVLLAGSMTWLLWLALSGLSEPLFIFGIALAYMGAAWWAGRGRSWGLWLAAAGLTIAGLARFDAWGHAAVLSLWLGVSWLRAPRPRPHRLLVATGLPWIFPIFWLVYQYVGHGNPFAFTRGVQSYYLQLYGELPLAQRLSGPFTDLWQMAGLAAPLSLAGFWLLRRQPVSLLLALMWLGSFGLLLVSTANYVLPAHNLPRQVIAQALLLAPGAGLALERLSRHSRLATTLALALVIAMLVPRLIALPLYQTDLRPDTIQVGRHIGGLRNEGRLPPGKIMVEVLFWDYLQLHVLTNDPAGVVYDRPPKLVIKPGGLQTLDDQTNPSVLALPPDQLLAELRRRGVGTLIVYSERAVANLRPIAQLSEHVGRFSVFVLPRPGS